MDAALLDRHRTYLEQNLTSSRLRHSLGVMQVMSDLAEIYMLDSQQAQLTGLLHDAAKDLNPSMAKAACASWLTKARCKLLPGCKPISISPGSKPPESRCISTCNGFTIRLLLAWKATRFWRR